MSSHLHLIARTFLVGSTLLLAGTPACADEGTTASDEGPVAGGGAVVAGGGAAYHDFVTANVAIPAGQEGYTCFVASIPEGMQINRFSYEARPGVHHLLFNRVVIGEEPEGSFDCSDVTFKPAWLPLFATGNGNQELVLPPGAAQTLEAGSQLLLQMHLLNATSSDITTEVRVRMFKTSEPNPAPVNLYVFGTTEVELPPGQATSVVHECTTRKDVSLIAMFPHMHYLGTSMVLEAGDPSRPGAPMREIYRRDPWDFDNQAVDNFEMMLPTGTPTRITCNYRNPQASTVGFGESSLDEMCFLLGYQVGGSAAESCAYWDPMKLKQLLGT